MSILKSYTDNRGLVLGYHRVNIIRVYIDSTTATVQSWASKEAFESDKVMPIRVQDVPIPYGVITVNPIGDVEQWLITNADSPLHGGELDVEANPLDKAKATAVRKLTDQQYAREFGGVDVPEIGRFATDVSSQRLLIGSAVLALIASSQKLPFEVDWTLADGKVVSLDTTGVIMASVVVGQHVAGAFDAGRRAKAAVAAAESVDDVTKVVL